MKGIHDPKWIERSRKDWKKCAKALQDDLQQAHEPWCYEGGGQAVNGSCPTHNGDACLRTPEGLVEMIQRYQAVWGELHEQPTPYDPNFGDDRVCKCGHFYYRHFDTYENMFPCGCKYCRCYEFEERSLDDFLKLQQVPEPLKHCPNCFADCHVDHCAEDWNDNPGQLWWICLKCNKWVGEVDG